MILSLKVRGCVSFSLNVYRYVYLCVSVCAQLHSMQSEYFKLSDCCDFFSHWGNLKREQAGVLIASQPMCKLHMSVPEFRWFSLFLDSDCKVEVWQWKLYAAEMIHGLRGHIRPSKFMGLAWTLCWAVQQEPTLGRTTIPSTFPLMYWVTMKSGWESNKILGNTFLWIFYNHQTHPRSGQKNATRVWFPVIFLVARI